MEVENQVFPRWIKGQIRQKLVTVLKRVCDRTKVYTFRFFHHEQLFRYRIQANNLTKCCKLKRFPGKSPYSRGKGSTIHKERSSVLTIVYSVYLSQKVGRWPKEFTRKLPTGKAKLFDNGKTSFLVACYRYIKVLYAPMIAQWVSRTAFIHASEILLIHC